MKKAKIAILALALAIVVMLPTMVIAQPLHDIPQRTENGVVYVPLRLTAYAHDARVEWNGDTRTVYITDVDGNRQSVIVEAVGGFIEDGTSWIPLEFATGLFPVSNEPAVPAVQEEDDEKIIIIITGRYGQGTPEENEMVASILGREDTQKRFNIYFNWFNTVHEIGHIVEHSLQDGGFGFLEGELFANAFAAGFWAHYGDEDTFGILREIVSHAVENTESPLPEIEDIYDFARLWEQGDADLTAELFSFESYGWFQFNLVYRVLDEMRDFASVLRDAGIEINEVPPQYVITTSLGEYNIPEILRIVFTALRDDWGIEMPANVYFMQSDEPHVHAVMTFTPEMLLDIRTQLAQQGLYDLSIDEILEILLPVVGLGEAGETIPVWSVN